MSTATDLAAFDAACTEAELSDEEREAVKETIEAGASLEEAVAFVLTQREEGGDDDVSTTGPPAELGEPTAQQLKALEKQTDRHLEKVHTIMGGHVADFEPCSECGGIGLVPPGPRPKENPNFKACETCAGFGQVKTGSLRQGNEARDCPTCMGRGYLERLDPQGNAGGNGAPVGQPQTFETYQGGEQVAPPPVAPPAQGEQWGVPTWMGDPNLANR